MNDNVKIPENLEVSPISGKESVIVETVNEKISRICMDSGYMTNDDFSFDNIELIEKYEESMPQIIIDDKHIGGYNELVEYYTDKGLVNFKGEKINADG